MKIVRATKNDDVTDIILLAANCAFVEYEVSDNKECCQYLFSQKNNKFSYENTYLLKDKDQIVGAYIIYSQKDEASLAKNMAQLLKNKYNRDIKVQYNEGCQNTYYIDSFAIKREYQNKGLSNILFTDMKKRFNSLSLLVDIENSHAIKTYKKQGFIVISELNIFGTNHYQMIYKER